MIVNEPERRGRLFFFIWTGILLVGIAVMLYPKVGKIWNAGRQSRVVDGYERSVEKLDVRKEEEMIAQTRAYNVMLLEQNNPVPNDKNADSYGALLNMTSDGVMGYLEIPAGEALCKVKGVFLSFSCHISHIATAIVIGLYRYIQVVDTLIFAGRKQGRKILTPLLD